MELEEAMAEVRDAIEDLRRRPERVDRVADALLAERERGTPQKELVKETGWTRETVRRHVLEARARRDATPVFPKYDDYE